MIKQNVELIQSKMNELSISELAELLKKLREQINTLAKELNDKLKLHYKHVELEYKEIANSTLEFMKSIKYIYNNYLYYTFTFFFIKT